MSSQYFNSDTIAAIVTAANAISGVGIIRVSGPSAWSAVSRVVRRRAGSSFESSGVESHKLVRCIFVGADGREIDDGMMVWMKAPNSFTGEDVFELHLHGSPLLLRAVMHQLQKSGVREALPGEFSFRAFRNGKLTLDEAESIADLISSRSEEGARRALNHLLGRPRAEIEKLKKELVDRLAEVEIDIDFSDQGLSVFQHENWALCLEKWVARVTAIREDFLRSQPARDGIRLALVGEPNSGKSSLFNSLLGEDRSIVSQEAGTTRDVVREAIEVRGLLFRISDTAGIRSTGNEIEAEGINRSFGEAESAHLVLWIFDGSKSFSKDFLKNELSVFQQKTGSSAKVIAVWNKNDLSEMAGDWKSFFLQRKIAVASVSAKNGRGLDSLVDEITRLFSVQAVDQPDFSISRMRHFEVLGKAAESVTQAIQKVRSGEHFPDLLAADLRSALHSLGELTGEFTSDDLLNHIFAEFCIGK